MATRSTLHTAYVFNGPNLNLLGQREPAVYGTETLGHVEQQCAALAAEFGWHLDFRQTNHEGELVDWLQEAGRAQAAGRSVGAVLNAGALTHTSIGIADAVAGSDLRVIEVHISNVHARESFRHHSYVSAVAAGIIVGIGVAGYPLALRALRVLGGAGAAGEPPELSGIPRVRPCAEITCCRLRGPSRPVHLRRPRPGRAPILSARSTSVVWQSWASTACPGVRPCSHRCLRPRIRTPPRRCSARRAGRSSTTRRAAGGSREPASVWLRPACC